jgi:acyl-coenzyme A synthetase/AMP-(fatty) acid ligase
LPVAEVAVLSGLGRPGLKDICVALVAAPEQHAAIAEGLRAEVFPPGAELSIGFLIALPRTPNGKIQRAAIRAALAATETVPPGH